MKSLPFILVFVLFSVATRLAGADENPINSSSAKPPTAAAPGISLKVTSGTITAPFVVTNDCICQPVATGMSEGGRACYRFTVTEEAEYAIVTILDASSEMPRTLLVNIDTEPLDPGMAWNISATAGFELRVVSVSATGNAMNTRPAPRYFSLGAGPHELILKGSLAGVRLREISLVKRPPRPQAPRISLMAN